MINLEFPLWRRITSTVSGAPARRQQGARHHIVQPEDAPLLEKVEAVLDTRLPQQWFPGFEPDLTRFEPDRAGNSKAAQKQRARKQALAGSKGGKGKR